MESVRNHNRQTDQLLEVVTDELEMCQEALDAEDFDLAKRILGELRKRSFPFLQEIILQGSLFSNHLGDLLDDMKKIMDDNIQLRSSSRKITRLFIALLILILAGTWGFIIAYVILSHHH
jgi:hypothetical protein